MGKAQLLEQRSDIALVIVDAETLMDDALEIDASPSHDAVGLPVWARFDDGGRSVLWLSDRRGAGLLAQASRSPSGPALLNR
jgi:hypothetical protein